MSRRGRSSPRRLAETTSVHPMTEGMMKSAQGPKGRRTYKLALLVVGAALLMTPVSRGGVPLPPAKEAGPAVALLIGKWKIEYANEVIEEYEFQRGGEVSVVEPVRITGGKAVVNGNSVVIVFENGR